MKKKSVVFMIFVIFLLSSSFVSAGFADWFKDLFSGEKNENLKGSLFNILENSTRDGVCLIGSAPKGLTLSDPDVGEGYAKKNVPEAKTFEELEDACTDDVMEDLMDQYCEINDNPQQWSISFLGYSRGCYKSFNEGGCNFHYCDLPEGTDLAACIVRNKEQLELSPSDPDVGKNYAKRHMSGINDISSLRKVCTKNVFLDLMQEYCAENSLPVLWEVEIFGSIQGSALIDGSFDNSYHDCSCGNNAERECVYIPKEAHSSPGEWYRLLECQNNEKVLIGTCNGNCVSGECSGTIYYENGDIEVTEPGTISEENKTSTNIPDEGGPITSNNDDNADRGNNDRDNQDDQTDDQEPTTSTTTTPQRSFPNLETEEVIEVNIEESKVIGDNIEVTSQARLDQFKKKVYVIHSSGSPIEIKVSPDEAIEIVKQEIRITIIDEAKIIEHRNLIVYEIDCKKQVKIIALVPVNMDVETKINIQSGDIVDISKPWWSFLASEE